MPRLSQRGMPTGHLPSAKRRCCIFVANTISGRHASNKRGTPQLNGKVERSHGSGGQEFYQLLSYKGDVDLEAKPDEW